MYDSVIFKKTVNACWDCANCWTLSANANKPKCYANVDNPKELQDVYNDPIPRWCPLRQVERNPRPD